jgi:hypothetical protein
MLILQKNKIMKTITISILCFCLLFLAKIQAQDVIVPTKGSMFECKIIKTDEQIIYYAFKSAPKVEYTIKREDVKELLFNKTLNEVIQSQVPTKTVDSTNTISSGSSTNMFLRGQADAKVHYRAYSGAATGTFFATVLFGGIGGIFTAIACADTPPKPDTLGYPDFKLKLDPTYRAGYEQVAHAKKRKKVWQNFGAGMGTLLLMVFIATR